MNAVTLEPALKAIRQQTHEYAAQLPLDELLEHNWVHGWPPDFQWNAANRGNSVFVYSGSNSPPWNPDLIISGFEAIEGRGFADLDALRAAIATEVSPDAIAQRRQAIADEHYWFESNFFLDNREASQ